MRLWILSLCHLGHTQPCETGQCFPAVGDLLIGRGERLFTNSTCGLDEVEDYCIVSNTDGQGSCFKCDSRMEWSEYDSRTNRSHRIQNIIMTRGGSRDGHGPWWQSENGKDHVYIQLDLEAQFSFTHLIMTFKTFRPAAMVVKRSSDWGKTWKPYRYFAEDCEPFIAENPEIAPGPVPTSIDEIICDHSYNKKVPSQRGEIVLKVLEPQLHDSLRSDPYSDEVMELLKVTNIRIEFLKLHTLGDDHIDSSMGTYDSNKKYYYALYNLVVRGSCFCYGHASSCRPLEGDSKSASVPGMVHGRCDCEHHTTGMNCEKCLPFYQDVPWKPAKEGDTSRCKPCNCHNHSDQCQFDKDVWETTGNKSGGVCDSCRHNTEGIHCERCIQGFFHDQSKDLTDPEMCVSCDCDPDGSLNGGICDHETHPDYNTVAGKCHCKANVTGKRCDQCKAGYHSLDNNDPDGCTKCDCDAAGTESGQESPCNPLTGQCYCKRNTQGENCDTCIPGAYGLKENDVDGCKPCLCDIGASEGPECNQLNGQCVCKHNIMGRQCTVVRPETFIQSPQITTQVTTHTSGANTDHHGGSSTYVSSYPEIIRYRIDKISVVWPTPVMEGSRLAFQINDIPRSMHYRFYLRYLPTEFSWKHIRVDVQRPDSGSRNPESECFNIQPSEDSWPASLPISHGGSRKVDHILGQENNMPCLETNEDKGTDEAYFVYVYFGDDNDDANDEKQKMYVDSLILRPLYNDVPIFDPTLTLKAAEYQRAFFNEDCLIKELELLEGEIELSPTCSKMTYSIAAWFRNGAVDCDCDKQGSLDTQCNPRGGQCTCRPGVTGRQCDRCKVGFYGFNSKGCTECICNHDGTINANQRCDEEDGKCACKPGIGLRDCSGCLPGYWGFPYCEKCECNGHATTCDAPTGSCNDCAHNTKGDFCEECADGYFGNAKQYSHHTGSKSAIMNQNCSPCPCPDGPGSGRQFASSCYQGHDYNSRTDEVSSHTLVCRCDEGYIGEHCDTCAPGYYGNPHEIGGRCQPCQCNGNIDLTDPDACDAATGECLICQHNRASPDCYECADGFYESGGECVSCRCDGNGSSDNICDKSTGQCSCLSYVDGRTCDRCKLNFYDLENAVESSGCKACACDPINSMDPETACDQGRCNPYSGQCSCKPGFGGRDCSTCQNGYWGDPHAGDCKSCNCSQYGTIFGENTCDPFTGQCLCREGMGSKQCDKCARGYKGEVPYCTPCGECFDSWDVIIQKLIAETRDVLDQVNTIQEKGVAGAYDSQFAEIEGYLNEAREVLDSEDGMVMLQKRMQEIESKNEDGNIRLTQIYHSFDEIKEKIVDQEDSLSAMQSEMIQYSEQLDYLKKELTHIADKDPEMMWLRIGEMVRNATKLEILAKNAVGFNDNDFDNYLSESERIRKEVEEAIPAREEEFTKGSQELGEIIDQTTSLSELNIGEINELVCGVNTETCDATCGGAQCAFDGAPHCGNPNYKAGVGERCESSAYQMAYRALTHAYQTQTDTTKMKEKVDAAMTETLPIREKAKEAHEDAFAVNQQAQTLTAEINDYFDKISNLVEDIHDFLKKDEHTKPNDILKLAHDVLELELPDQQLIDQLKAQMAQLGMEKNKSGGDDSTEASFGEFSHVQAEASDVLTHARELAEKVSLAIQNYKESQSNCIEAASLNSKAKENAVLAEEVNADINTNIRKLQALVDNLRNLVNEDGGVGSQVREINRKITGATQNNKNATATAEESEKIYAKVKEGFEATKSTEEYAEVKKLTRRVDEMRQTQDLAYKLQSDVDKLMTEVQDYRSKWDAILGRHDQVKRDVELERNTLDSIKARAMAVRQAIHDKLYKPSTCPGSQ